MPAGPDARRLEAGRRGYMAEWIAAIYLMFKGYRVKHLRYRTRAGEIDIIARKGNVAVFVEVKARSVEQAAVDAVGALTQSRIRAASDIWLARQRDAAQLSLRYDIIAILPGRWPRHFRDAF